MNDNIGIILLSIFVFIEIYLLASIVPELNALIMAGFITGLFIIMAFMTKQEYYK
jgi:hypothetical protein